MTIEKLLVWLDEQAKIAYEKQWAPGAPGESFHDLEVVHDTFKYVSNYIRRELENDEKRN